MTQRIEVRPWGIATTIYFGLYDPITPGDLVTGLSFDPGDVLFSKNGAAPGNTTNLPTEIGSTGIYKLLLDANSETVGEFMLFIMKDQTVPKAWMDNHAQIEFSAWKTAVQEMQIWTVDDTDAAPTATTFEASIVHPSGSERTTVDAYKDSQVICVAGAEPGAKAFIKSSNAGVGANRAFGCTNIPTGPFTTGDRLVVI